MRVSHRYFEEKGQYDKAVQLYQKGGNVSRALEICFKAQLFDELRDIGSCLLLVLNSTRVWTPHLPRCPLSPLPLFLAE